MHVDLVTVWWFPASYGIMVTDSVSYQLLISDLESFLLISCVPRFSFFSFWEPREVLFCSFLKLSSLFQQNFFRAINTFGVIYNTSMHSVCFWQNHQSIPQTLKIWLYHCSISQQDQNWILKVDVAICKSRIAMTYQIGHFLPVFY